MRTIIIQSEIQLEIMRCEGCGVEVERSRHVKHPRCESCKRDRIRAVYYAKSGVDPEKKRESITDRALKIVEMRLEGMTLEDIAKVFSITRERVRQILAKIEREANIKFPVPSRMGELRVKRIDTVCGKEGCKTAFQVKETLFKGHGEHRCQEHRYRNRFPYPKGMVFKSINEQRKYRYHHDPEFRKRVNERYYAWHKKEMANPNSKHRKHFLEYQANYQKNKRKEHARGDK